jgi:hypothetical protein
LGSKPKPFGDTATTAATIVVPYWPRGAVAEGSLPRRHLTRLVIASKLLLLTQSEISVPGRCVDLASRAGVHVRTVEAFPLWPLSLFALTRGCKQGITSTGL